MTLTQACLVMNAGWLVVSLTGTMRNPASDYWAQFLIVSGFAMAFQVGLAVSL